MLMIPFYQLLSCPLAPYPSWNKDLSTSPWPTEPCLVQLPSPSPVLIHTLSLYLCSSRVISRMGLYTSCSLCLKSPPPSADLSALWAHSLPKIKNFLRAGRTLFCSLSYTQNWEQCLTCIIKMRWENNRKECNSAILGRSKGLSEEIDDSWRET